MEYITEIKSFYRLMQTNDLSTGQVALWHALMYLNNECYWKEWFTVSNTMLELYTGLSRQAILKNRNILKQIGMIDFKPNGTKATSYKIKTMSNSCQDSCQDSCQISSQVVVKPVAHSNRHKTKDIDKDILLKKEVKEKKNYGDFGNVTLTDSEFEKIKNKYFNYEELISFLDCYIEEKGYKSNSHYVAIIRWVATAVEERKKQSPTKKGPLNNYEDRKPIDYSYITNNLIEKQGASI